VFVAAKIFIESARVLGCRLVIRRRAKSSHTAEFLDGEREREREMKKLCLHPWSLKMIKNYFSNCIKISKIRSFFVLYEIKKYRVQSM
jgi:hypothetical protein